MVGSQGIQAGQRAEFNANWETGPYFRGVMRLPTVVWGLALEAVLRTGLAYTLPTLTFLAVSLFVQYGIFLRPDHSLDRVVRAPCPPAGRSAPQAADGRHRWGRPQRLLTIKLFAWWYSRSALGG